MADQYGILVAGRTTTTSLKAMKIIPSGQRFIGNLSITNIYGTTHRVSVAITSSTNTPNIADYLLFKNKWDGYEAKQITNVVASGTNTFWINLKTTGLFEYCLFGLTKTT